MRWGRRGGEHDDLVIALALACWRAQWSTNGYWEPEAAGDLSYGVCEKRKCLLSWGSVSDSV